MPSSTITARPTLAADGRRHSTRSIRSNVVRPTNYYARPVGYRGAGNNQAGGKSATNDAPGFCPAIEHFTDGLAALPKEVMRHLTLLKETEGKAYQFDEQIRDTLTTIEALPDPPRHSSTNYSHPFFLGLSLANSVNGSAHGSIADGATPALRSSQFELADDANAATSETMTDEQTELRHRHFHQLQSRLSELLVVLDEKNMVLSTANDTLDRQLARLDGTMPYVEQEISEEARLGSNTHWALAHMKDSRRANGTSNVGSARRDAQGTNSLVAAAAAVHEVDVAAARSEARREVMLARSKNKHVESDFDERPVARKVSGISKSRKAAEPAAHEVSKDSNTATVASTSNKRRRIDKTVPAMEKSMSQALAGKLAAPSSATREGPAVDNKKKAIKQPLPAPIARKRAQPESPRLASSPTRGTFATTTNKESSASGSRNGQPRRQNSIQSARSGVPENQKARPSSSTSQPKAVNGASTSDLAHVADVTGRSIGEVRANLKDNYVTEDGDRAVETDGLQGALVVKAAESVVANTLKREETEPMEQDGEAKGISSVPMASTRSRQGSKISKASLPTASPFGEVGSALHGGAGMSRSRSTRNAASNHASPAFGPVDLSSRRAGGSSHSKKSSISGMASHHNNGSNAAGTTTTTSTTSPTRKSARKSPFDALSPTSTPNDIPTMSLTNSTNHTANSRFTANHDSAGIHGSGGGRPPSRPASSRKNTIDPLGPSSPTAAPDGTDRDPDETASMPADSPEVPRSSTRRSGGGATTTSDALTSTSTSAIIPATTSSFPTSTKSTPTATSSKAGASAAVSAAVPTEPDDEEVELDADVDGPPSSPDSNEPRYCVCGQVSYGDMIACDNDSCPREWFHLACVGLTKAPAGKAKWFCEECKEGMARARGEHGGGSGGGNGKEGGGGGGGGGAGAGAGAGGKERRR